MKTTEKIIISLIMCIMVIGLMIALRSAVIAEDRADCIKWAGEAKIYPRYFITKYQQAQCDYHGIEIGAPVR